MKKALLVIFLAGTMAFAQASAGQPKDAVSGTPASREDVLRLFAALHLEAQMNNMMTVMRKNMDKLIGDSLPPNELAKMTPEQRERFDAYMKRTQDRMLKMFPVDEMLEDFIPVYQKNISKEDIDAVVAFYQSPAGTRLLDRQPKMMEESMTILMPKLQERMKIFVEETQKDIDAMVAKEHGDGLSPHPEKRPVPQSLKN